MTPYILPFNQISLANLPEVGGKNASLGEMFNKLKSLGIEVPDGLAVTVAGYRTFLAANNLTEVLTKLLNSVDNKTLANLPEIALQCRELVSKSRLPEELRKEILRGYRSL